MQAHRDRRPPGRSETALGGRDIRLRGREAGIVVTTGRFTEPAREYVERLDTSGDPYPIELIDGTDLRSIADEIGLDLYNGRIEILCSEALRPYDPAASVRAPVEEAFGEIDNLDVGQLPEPHSRVSFRPVVTVTADTNAVFETPVGVVHRIDDRTRFVVHADRGRPTVAESSVADLVVRNRDTTVDADDERIRDAFDEVEEHRFGQTQSEYTEWAVDRLREHHTTTVTYTGDNNVTYTKECEPSGSDVTVRSVDPVYLPAVRHTTHLEEYTYPFEYFAAGPSRVATDDRIRACVHCDTAGRDGSYTYCANCGAIACPSHTRTERLEQAPVCTGCAVTERFALKTKYFYDEENRESFREQYADMPIHRKAMENTWLVAGGAVAAVLTLLATLVVAGAV
ncbi:restriction endonuclease [Halobaculum litoreum]|uniref:Restriction endonuclease n=1 Tax=Halobaculum litoreum TaxID=3031998 RepID=A0ABD5XT24_9EURY